MNNSKAKQSIIYLEDIWKVYEIGNVKVEALRGVTISIKPGEFVSITGPSGSGKSTMMNMVGALDFPTKGAIYLDGKDISKLHESELAIIRGQKIGFVFQQFNLISTLTALENVMLPMEFQDKADAEKRAINALELVGLKERMGHKPKELSGGQQQRVAIARALANDPEVILADEPTGNLDSKTGKEIMTLFQKLHKEGKTIVLITHDLNLVKYGERIIKLIDGQISKKE
ncbi:putative ABC transporter ATP-binding protein [uncultured archaeon]|nr:putative ABC transporter ATP-binding protein [uncultured archaeon]